MKQPIFTLFLLLFLFNNSSASDCGNGRYKNKLFSTVKRTNNIVYATKPQSNGVPIQLRYDVYEPQGDTGRNRAVMLLIHGGAYLKLLDQNSPDIVLLCNYFAQLGYVAISIDYRQEPNLLGLLSEEVMVKAVSRALIDTKDAIDHLIDTYSNGNPYRIDTSKAFIGGVSAGAVSTMFITYLDSLQMLSPKYQQWIIDANGVNADSILRHRFDKIKPKAAISISGAILDTNWIKPNGIDLLLNHGSVDPIVPYNYGKPFSIPTLPYLYGGKAMNARALHQGIYVEFEDWIGRSHVPFFNLDLGNILTLQLINQPIFDSTKSHIKNFCYRLLDCNRVTGIRENVVDKANVFPNPTQQNFTVELPKAIGSKDWTVELYDILGKQVFARNYDNSYQSIEINQNLSPNIYFLKMYYEQNGETFVYTAKVVIGN